MGRAGPALDHPKVVTAAAATYLQDANILFGVGWNGVARAYPKRILAWLEMALDCVDGVSLTLVYCTLCGTVIPYESRGGGTTFTFATSGLLSMSNKVMFDMETKPRSILSASRLGKRVVKCPEDDAPNCAIHDGVARTDQNIRHRS